MNSKKFNLSWLWLTFLVLIIDQVSKQWVANSLDLFEYFQITPFFRITYVHNPGAAFSFLADQAGWQRWLFTIIALSASIIFAVWLAKTPKKNRLLSVALALLLAGAVGNLIDRVFFGYVIDFLDFYIKNHHWPAFNIADSSIFIGAVLMIFDSLKTSADEKSAVKPKIK